MERRLWEGRGGVGVVIRAFRIWLLRWPKIDWEGHALLLLVILGMLLTYRPGVHVSRCQFQWERDHRGARIVAGRAVPALALVLFARQLPVNCLSFARQLPVIWQA